MNKNMWYKEMLHPNFMKPLDLNIPFDGLGLPTFKRMNSCEQK